MLLMAGAKERAGGKSMPVGRGNWDRPDRVPRSEMKGNVGRDIPGGRRASLMQQAEAATGKGVLKKREGKRS